MTNYQSAPLFSGSTSRDVLGQLQQQYPNYDSFVSGLVDVFNQHVAEFPPGYTYRDLIELGLRRRWISVESREGEHVVEIDLTNSQGLQGARMQAMSAIRPDMSQH